MGSFEAVGIDSAGRRFMRFKNGQRCHNGPARSLTLFLECGGGGEGGKDFQHRVVEVAEERICEYEALVKSPVGCDERWAERAGLVLEGEEGRSERRGGEL